MDLPATWYCYSGGLWSRWAAMDPPFPLTGTVKGQYDYAGADAAVLIDEKVGRVTPGSGGASVSNAVTWSAAAKPFGFLNKEDRPNEYGIVLPAYREARLIPVDASSGSAAGGFDLEWRRHKKLHLPVYVRTGVTADFCWYCKQLRTWERPEFRQEGATWLEANWRLCIRRGGGGGGGGHRTGGGTRRGH
jgi:hypothetical protein